MTKYDAAEVQRFIAALGAVADFKPGISDSLLVERLATIRAVAIHLHDALSTWPSYSDHSRWITFQAEYLEREASRLAKVDASERGGSAPGDDPKSDN